MNGSNDVIDWSVIEELRALGDGDDGFLTDLIQTFLSETPILLGRLREAVAAEDPANIRLNAHSLKGSSAEFGASYLTDLCRQLEMAGKNQELSSVHDLMAEVEDEYGRVAQALSRAIHP